VVAALCTRLLPSSILLPLLLLAVLSAKLLVLLLLGLKGVAVSPEWRRPLPP
jgi:hypothetical protein